MKALVAALLALTAHSRTAGALSSSCRHDGWGTAPNSTLPVHPRITFYADRGWDLVKSSTVAATIDGKAVPTAVTIESAPPFDIATIEIQSDRTGALKVDVMERRGQLENPSATFTIAKRAQPTHVHGKPSRFHRAYHHSTVRESWDGLAVAVDATVTEFSVHWRRDAQSDWNTLIVPGSTLEDSNVLHLGEISCVENFSVTWLERGIDLELKAKLPDGTWVPVEGLPSHIVLEPLAPGTDVSTPPN